MTETALLLLALIAFGYALVARRLADGIVTPPMVFLGLGMIASFRGDLVDPHGAEAALHLLAEATLVIVLFTDAAMIRTSHPKAWVGWSARMLLVGMPLAVLGGFLVAWAVLPGWPVWEMALLAAILAPTDAALGQAVVTNPAVPERIRKALTVESGVNDGLALPAVLFFACLAVGGVHEYQQSNWLAFTAKQVGLGTLVGALLGLGGGWLMRRAQDSALSNDIFEGIGVLALAGLSYLLADAVGGNGFLAAFAAGLCFGAALGQRSGFIVEFIETEGQLLVLMTFLLLGLSITPEALAAVEGSWVVLVVLSLFVTRPLAIALSLIGTDAPPLTRLFMGWFGPRGLATALFALLVLRDFELLRHGDEILMICFIAVCVSTFLHGISAAPAARWISQADQGSLSAPKRRDTA